jgi:hypothetical protein
MKANLEKIARQDETRTRRVGFWVSPFPGCELTKKPGWDFAQEIMGNNAGKEGDRSRGAASNKKSSAGGMFRQGSMNGEQGNKGAQKGTNTTSSWGSSLKRVVAGVGTQIVISEKSSEGSWPPFAVSSVQGMRKGMEDEFYAGGEVGFHPFLPLARFDFPQGSRTAFHLLRLSPFHTQDFSLAQSK